MDTAEPGHTVPTGLPNDSRLEHSTDLSELSETEKVSDSLQLHSSTMHMLSPEPGARNSSAAVECNTEHELKEERDKVNKEEMESVRSESMVTIRLSESESLEKEQLLDLKQGFQDADSVKSQLPYDSDKEKQVIMAHQPSRVRFSEHEIVIKENDSPLSIICGAVDDRATRSYSRRTGLNSTRSSGQSSGSRSSRSVDASEPGAPRSRSMSAGSSDSEEIAVDWNKLDENEQKEHRDEQTDESTAFLLARLEQENNALATDPKASVSRTRSKRRSRPPSLQYLKKLVNEPTPSSLRYSMLPTPPPMTELDFWSALVKDYPQTAQRLPTLTSTKIRNGVPPPLRGVVWVSITGARDSGLEDEYEKLCLESSPYEKAIGKDIGRSFPGVDMFQDPNGNGQRMLSKVLNAFSLWDQEIGYCQGLGFVVGPLLMHMPDKEAFCVLVRLMGHYDLRSCFLPDLSGLHLRIYQFQNLLEQHLPELSAHLESLKVEPLYCSQWFLSFFGVTCPLPMLIRIYDVILTEGASETLMRVALSLMRRNEQKILATTEFEDVMQLLLSRHLWDTYGGNGDELVADFCGLTGLVTREGLQALEVGFRDSNADGLNSQLARKPNVHTAATSFLGRFWAGSGSTSKLSVTSPSLCAPSRPGSFLRRTPSKQSMASTLNSIESNDSQPSGSLTDVTNMSRQPSSDYTTKPNGDWVPIKPTSIVRALGAAGTVATMPATPNKDSHLHSQIEDLLTALGDMQREQQKLVDELQREREEREEDRELVKRVVEQLRTNKENDGAVVEEEETPTLQTGLAELDAHFATKSTNKRSSLSLTTKQQMREEAAHIKEQYHEEVARSADLIHQLEDKNRETAQVTEQLREARARLQEASREKHRQDRMIQDLRNKKPSALDKNSSDTASPTGDAPANGLRELRLGKASSTLDSRRITAPALSPSQPSPSFSKRLSSLSTQSILATEDHKPVSEDALLLELVNAKTGEAVAKQELEEVKQKLEALRKLLGASPTSPGAGVGKSPLSFGASYGGLTGGLTSPTNDPTRQTPPTPNTPSGGGFFSGWGKRAVSSGAPLS